VHEAVRHNELVVPLPLGWEDATQVVLAGESEGAFRPNLVIGHELGAQPGETAESFARRQLSHLRDALVDYAVVEERHAQFGALSGFLREHTFIASEGVRVQQLQFYVRVGATFYTFTYTHTAQRFGERRDEMLELLETIQIGPEEPRS